MAIDIAKLNEIENTSRQLVALSEKFGIEVETGTEIGELFPTNDIKKMTEDINETINCEVLQAKIDEHIRELKDMIKAGTKESEILALFKELFKIPGNPLKIISWVKKFVSKYLLSQVMALIDFIQQLTALVEALKALIAAVQLAQVKVQLCAASVIDNTLDTVIDEALDLVGTSQQDIDNFLAEFNEVQNLVSSITGQPPVFNTSSVSSFLSDVKGGAKDKLTKQVNDYAAAPFEEAGISVTMTGDATGTASSDPDTGDITISTTVPIPETTITMEGDVTGTATSDASGNYTITTTQSAPSSSLSLTGDVTGSASTDESGNFSISTSISKTTVTVLDEDSNPIEITVFS